MSFLLNGEPVILNNLPDYSAELERKRSHKRRRKIRKPIKGLR